MQDRHPTIKKVVPVKWIVMLAMRRRFPSFSQRHRSFSSSVLTWYSKKLDTHPILTKAISSGIVGGSGDVLSQYIEHNDSFWDVVRTTRFCFLGTVLVGPVVHAWYGILLRRVPGQSARAVAQRVFVDQTVFGPLFLPVFLSGLWLLESNNNNNLVDTLVEQVPSAIVANWVLWVPAQAINFSLVPAKFQVLFSNCTGLIWNAYLSYTAHRHSDQKNHHNHKVQDKS